MTDITAENLAQVASDILVDEGYITICELHETPYTDRSEIDPDDTVKLASMLGVDARLATKAFNLVLQNTGMDCGYCEKNANSD